MEVILLSKIKIKTITFRWSESPEIKVNTTVKTFKEANYLIHKAALSMPENSGYRKTGFIIEWEDGRKYKGRIDIEKEHLKKNNPLGEHVKFFYEFLAGIKKPDNWTWDEHKRILKTIYYVDDQCMEEVKQFLETYALDDIVD